MRSLFRLALLAAAGCTAPATIDAPVVPPATIDVASPPQRPKPTGWRYHPQRVAGILNGRQLADGRWLLVGELGERWLTERDDEGLFAQAATTRAGEPLEQVVPWSGGDWSGGDRSGGDRARWLFIGESGRSYFSREPLGPLTPGPKAPHGIATITATEAGALAADHLGVPLRFDGQTWEPLEAAPRLHGLASASSKVVFGMSLPERHWRSEDGGASWAPLSAGPFGTRRMISAAGRVVIEGATGAFEVRADGSVTGDVEAPPEPRSIRPEPRRGPSAIAVADDTAVLTADRYVEVFEVEEAHEDEADDGPPRRSGWRLVDGNLGERLEARSLPFDGHCDGTLLSVAGNHLWLGCGEAAGEAVRLRMLYSSDRGAHLRQVAVVTSSLPERVSVATDDRGRALVSAACPLDVSDCSPGPPLVVRPDGRLEPTVAPSLVGPSFEPTFGPKGRAYFLGERSKDGRVALFVSSDGERFEAQPLEPPRGHREPWSRELSVARSLHPDDSGAIGIVAHTTPPQYALADADGRLTTVASLPEHAVAVGGHGRHILALTKHPGATAPTAFEAWASNDGGLSFRAVPMPMVLEPDELDDDLRLACSSRGCVIGTRLTRLGWNPEAPADAPLRRPDIAGVDPRPATRTPIACTVTDDPWVRHDEVSGGEVLPHSGEIWRGNAAWSLLRHAPSTGQVEALAMMVDDDRPPRLERQGLLPKARKRDRWAIDVLHQLEGYAAVRVPLPSRRDSLEGEPMRRLEAAWINYLTGTQARGTIADAGSFHSDDVTPGQTPTLVTGLVSVAPGGLVVRPSAKRPDVWLIDEAGGLSARTQYPRFPATRFARSTLDATVVDGRAFGVGMYFPDDSGQASVVALTPMGQSDTRFSTVGPPAPGRVVQTDWTYRAGRTGIAALLFDPARNEGVGYFAPFTADGGLGPAEPVPTQRSIGDDPRACTAVERQGGVRIVTPPQTGTLHPVIVEDGVASAVMLTGAAVVYGSADAPCLAGWRARGLGARRNRIAVIRGDLSQAWLFEERGERTLAHRPMRCELAPDAEIPAIVWTQPGTVTTQ